MRQRPHAQPPRLLRRLHAEDGLTLIEVLASVMVLTVGLIGLIGAFNTSRKLTLLSERHTAMAHRAQLEIERVESLPYETLALTSDPTSETCNSYKSNPNCYVQAGGTTYQWNHSESVSSSKNTSELVIEATKGNFKTTASSSASACPASPEEKRTDPCIWTDGSLSGYVYDYVTWETDKDCSSLCKEKEKNYRRVTVVVTVKVPSGSREMVPVINSTLIV